MPPPFPAYIYGLHDLGGQDLMLGAQRPGWLLDSIDLRSQAGADYSALADAGLGIIVRLNHGSSPIPPSNQYDAFAARCAAYVQNSPGARIWMIGSAMNARAARPPLPGGAREIITPQKYAHCFDKCRRAIKNVAGHADDLVIPGAVALCSDTAYPGNPNGDWVQYLVDLLNRLGADADVASVHAGCLNSHPSLKGVNACDVASVHAGCLNSHPSLKGVNACDGIALHCCTRDFDAAQISDDARMDAPFGHRHSGFRAYRDFLNALPAPFRTLPVFITEAYPRAGWDDSDEEWIQSAYQEIDDWNADPAHQPIQALVLFRWQTLSDHPEWGIQDKPALIADFRATLSAGYRVRMPNAAPQLPEYRAQWLETIAIPDNAMVANMTRTGRVMVKNIGAQTWNASGANSVRLGYRWFNARGEESPIAGDFALPNDVAPGETAIFDPIELCAPASADAYTLKWDLACEGLGWLSAQGCATQDVSITVTAPAAPLPTLQPLAPTATAEQFAARFLAHDTPVSVGVGEIVTVNLRVKNTGASAWAQGGSHPVHVGYKWFDAAGQPKLDVEDRRTALPSDLAVGEETTLGATLAAPKTPGTYRLRWDLVAEGITWFADVGSQPLDVPVSVTALPRDISGWRVEANRNPHTVAHALDGDPRTFWDSGEPQVPGQWLRLTLPAPRLIDGIQFLSPGKGFPAGYALRVSADGKVWTEVVRATGDNTYDVMAVFAPQTMQYAQMDLLAAAPSSWMISEILLHPATAWSANASHNAHAAIRAIDNRADTAWTSGAPQTPGMWFQIDLGRVETVSGLTLIPPANENPAAFRIATWNARASRWQIACEKINNDAPVDVTFAATPTQFVVIQLLQARAQVWAIREVRVMREMDAWLGPGTS